MSSSPTKPLDDAEGRADRYAPEALDFIREGLAHSIDQQHGRMTSLHAAIMKFLTENDLDWDDLQDLYVADQVEASLQSAIERIGGIDKLNRHISGEDLCWGLRDYAARRWGRMARVVLNHWGLRQTLDFGNIVFDAIEQGLMQKQPSDSLDDFKNVFEFKEAFEAGYVIEPDVE